MDAMRVKPQMEERDPAEAQVMTPCERANFRRQFVIALVNLRHLNVYWSPSERRILSRAVHVVKRHTLPADAVDVGTYAHPFEGDKFIGDLEALLVRLEVASRRSA